MSPTFEILDQFEGRTLRPIGEWTVLLLGEAATSLQEESCQFGQADKLDLSKLGRVDTSGAFVLLRALKEDGTVTPSHADFDRPMGLIRSAAQAKVAISAKYRPFHLFERIGRAVIMLGSESHQVMIFTGELVSALGRTIRHPRRLRLTPLFAVMEQAGIDAC
jgi:phospholipid/cholesterol/gamma-HCH transport system permease protein